MKTMVVSTFYREYESIMQDIDVSTKPFLEYLAYIINDHKKLDKRLQADVVEMFVGQCLAIKPETKAEAKQIENSHEYFSFWPDDDEKNEWFVPMVLKEPGMNIVYLKRKGA